MALKQLPDEWSAWFRLLSAHRVRYLVAGGWAVAAHAEPRATADLDIWVATGQKDLAKLQAALAQFGITGIDDGHFLAGNIITIGRAPLRLEILPDLLGRTFEDCWHRRKTLRVAGTRVHVLALQDLLAAKQAANRPKDQGDIAVLEILLNRKH